MDENVPQQACSIRRSQDTGQAIFEPDYRNFDRQKSSPVALPFFVKTQNTATSER
jgi:hypothetical protein